MLSPVSVAFRGPTVAEKVVKFGADSGFSRTLWPGPSLSPTANACTSISVLREESTVTSA